MLVFIYDFETTGVPLWAEKSDNSAQPHIVQAAAKLVEVSTRKTVSSFKAYVRPEGWAPEPDALALHGISEEMARAHGIDEDVAAATMYGMWATAIRSGGFRVGFSEGFDARILRIALKRYANAELADTWGDGTAQDAKNISSPLIAMGKTPTLVDAHAFFTNGGAFAPHDAMNDVEATELVWFAALARLGIDLSDADQVRAVGKKPDRRDAAPSRRTSRIVGETNALSNLE